MEWALHIWSAHSQSDIVLNRKTLDFLALVQHLNHPQGLTAALDPRMISPAE